MDNYVVYHAHTDYSNPTTLLDSTTKIEDYVQAAKDAGMKALGISEHGNIFEWTRKKKLIEDAGMKYIHATEAYVTETLEEKIRDNYHIVLIGLNKDGMKEINHLMSHEVASNRDDGHFYYSPRITFEELISTSDNIAITSACLGNILNKGSIELQKEFLKFAIENKHRVFLEIQHHNVSDQIKYNKKLHAISQKTGLRLIAGTDTHSLNEEHAKGRELLQKARNVHFAGEDGWDLTFKTYDELIEAYKKQNSLPMDVVIEAINNTNVLADMVETFELDDDFKYPELHEDSNKALLEAIKRGFKDRNIQPTQEILDRVKMEIEGFQSVQCIDYILLEDEIKKEARKNGIYYGPGRGSVTGSYIAYLLNITDVDPIERNLVFSRFINPDRVTVADVDTDYVEEGREWVKDYLFERESLYCANIITFGTLKFKSAMDYIGKALDKQKITNKIKAESVYDSVGGYIYDDSKNLEIRNQHKEIFKYFDIIDDVIIQAGTHAGGVIVSPYPLTNTIGTYVAKAGHRQVGQIDMNEIERFKFVKLDILGVTSLDAIDKTCKLANIDIPTPDTVDIHDQDVWESIKEDTTMIFQWEKNYANDYLRKLLSKETISKFKKTNPNITNFDLFVMGNAAIRPVGKSYRDDLASGVTVDHGHEALNEFLASRLGHILFQEDIIAFLNQFCGFTPGESDTVRRAFASVQDTSKFIPRIESGFIKTMKEKYNTPEEESKEIIKSFLVTIQDASGYLFSLNHSTPYSYIGYIAGYLRYHYTLEFLTASFDTFQGDADKTSEIYRYMTEHTNIKMKPIKFRYARASYSFDRDTNTIYKGMSSIKYMNNTVSEELYELRNNQYNSFIDLLVDIVENTSANSRQIKILIALDYFSEFGNPGQLRAIYDEFSDGKNKYKKTYVDATKEKRITALKEQENDVEYTPTTVADIVKAEKKYIGHISIIDERFKPNVALVSDLNINRWGTAFATLYRLNNGETEEVKIRGNVFENNPFKEMDLIQTITLNHEYKRRKDKNGKWYNTGETEPILSSYRIVEQG